MIKIKRIYDEYSESDGFRILIDRLWPRGISKDRAIIDRITSYNVCYTKLLRIKC